MAPSTDYGDARGVVRAKITRLASLLRYAAVNPALFSFRTVDFGTTKDMVPKETQCVIYEPNSLGSHMYRLCTDAERLLIVLAQIHDLADNANRVRASSSSYSTPSAPTTLHGFSQLPAELRLLIWKQVPCPVPSRHYGPGAEDLWADARAGRDGPYGEYIVDLFTATLPATHLLEDWGAWRACVDSRKAMVLAYTEFYNQRATDGSEQPDDLDFAFSTRLPDAYYIRLTQFNDKGAWLQQEFHKLYARFRVPVETQFPPLTLVNSLFTPTMSDEWLAFMDHEDTVEDFAWCKTLYCQTAEVPMSSSIFASFINNSRR
ncbi:hypothetical protein SCUCBS95973_004921 [Sporothrix curviconia]|uniref:Uncharacterized protein n=1 Tax=Sporothrix curviconia TaxID=1260050 RepID=A0ABP0BUI2_9PEZI